MKRWTRGVFAGVLLVMTMAMAGRAAAQKALTWDEVRLRFEANNPALQAGKLSIDESRANETTAYLRPNPNFTALLDQIDPFSTNPSQPLAAALPSGTLTYLHERQHKRELRKESAEKATDLAINAQADLERNLIFSLRLAFVQALQSKSLLALAHDNLESYDKQLGVHRERYKVGDMAQVDLNRLELQKLQFLSDVQTAEVALRNAKIQLLALLNDQTAVDQFDVDGRFDFSATLGPLDDYRHFALETRPDLKAAMRAIDKSETDHKLAIANGSTDPTFGADVGKNPPLDHYIGFSVSVPLRIFDRNQGEKLRTQIDIERQQRLADAARAQVFSDVDSAYTALTSTVSLLEPYKDTYLNMAVQVRDTMSFSYEHGGASLLDYLDAERDYRMTELNYLTLVGTYLMAVNQLNLAVGREVIQ
jgi:cobalt-zinc-cadmium efflux system outer membrane protein